MPGQEREKSTVINEDLNAVIRGLKVSAKASGERLVADLKIHYGINFIPDSQEKLERKKKTRQGSRKRASKPSTELKGTSSSLDNAGKDSFSDCRRYVSRESDVSREEMKKRGVQSLKIRFALFEIENFDEFKNKKIGEIKKFFLKYIKEAETEKERQEENVAMEMFSSAYDERIDERSDSEYKEHINMFIEETNKIWEEKDKNRAPIKGFRDIYDLIGATRLVAENSTDDLNMLAARMYQGAQKCAAEIQGISDKTGALPEERGKSRGKKKMSWKIKTGLVLSVLAVTASGWVWEFWEDHGHSVGNQPNVHRGLPDNIVRSGDLNQSNAKAILNAADGKPDDDMISFYLNESEKVDESTVEPVLNSLGVQKKDLNRYVDFINEHLNEGKKDYKINTINFDTNKGENGFVSDTLTFAARLDDNKLPLTTKDDPRSEGYEKDRSIDLTCDFLDSGKKLEKCQTAATATEQAESTEIATWAKTAIPTIDTSPLSTATETQTPATNRYQSGVDSPTLYTLGGSKRNEREAVMASLGISKKQAHSNLMSPVLLMAASTNDYGKMVKQALEEELKKSGFRTESL